MNLMHNEGKKSTNISLFHIIFLYSLGSYFLLIFLDNWIVRLFTLPFFLFILGLPLTYFISGLDSSERILVSFGISNLLLLFLYYFNYITAYYLLITPDFVQYITIIIIAFIILTMIVFLKKKEELLKTKLDFLKKIKNFFLANKYIILIVFTRNYTSIYVYR